MKKITAFTVPLFLFFVFAASFVVFAQVDVARRTMAITYPLDDPVDVQFRGTTRFPRMKGEARVKRSGRSGTKVELSVSKMPRPFELGAAKSPTRALPPGFHRWPEWPAPNASC